MADAAERGERELSRPGSGRWIVASALWSFTEATVFFVVPDVILSMTTVRCGLRTGAMAAGVAAIAAAAGGLAVYLATTHGIIDAFALFDRLPAISERMIAGVRAAFASNTWPSAMLAGAFSGVPYKLFAAAAAEASTPLLWFLLWSIPIRLVRFVIVVGASAMLRPLLLRGLGPRLSLLPVAAIWIGFYAIFWLRMPG